MRSLKPLAILVLIAGLSGLWWWKARREQASSPVEVGRPAPAAPKQVVLAGDGPLISTFDGLKKNPDALASLQDLQAKLRTMSPAEAVGWIRQFLATGKDKSTGLSFEIGADHALKQWPTFRTFLLDALRAVDPAAAAEIGREILAKPTNADEWALALRNIGLMDNSPETNALILGKTEALIANPAWQADPSVGYLNAFDVLVHTKATGSTPLLSELIQRKDRKDLVHAAFLTLDRLVQREPSDVLARLAADTTLQQSRPEMTAQQFARADLRDPAQQAIVKSWLLDPSRTGTELNSFAGIYPNNNHFVSNNLLTTENTQSGADLAAHDRAALEILNSWSEDPAFSPVKETLATMIGRLNGFVANPNE
jgi:hypothetical protein